jgi:hypothetical protein
MRAASSGRQQHGVAVRPSEAEDELWQGHPVIERRMQQIARVMAGTQRRLGRRVAAADDGTLAGERRGNDRTEQAARGTEHENVDG